MKRVVLDTNVTVSAVFWNGHPRAVYNLICEKRFVMLLSREMEEEFIRVLSYTKFNLSYKEIPPIVNNFRAHAELVAIHNKISEITADPTDNIFLECAVDGGADCIISGDKHLLDLGSYFGIPIVKVKGFLIEEGYLEEE